MDIDAIRAMYETPSHARGLRMEREFSPDGETETGLYPYTRIRIVKLYDAMRFIETREMVETGHAVEIW
jgi:hypothetical protein